MPRKCSHLILPVWLIQPKSAGPEGHVTQPCLPAIRPSCAGELAGLRQQVTSTEEKAALDKELMTQKLVQAEREAQASLREQRAAHEEDLQRLQHEKVWSWGGVGRALSLPVSVLSSVLPCLSFHICETDACHRRYEDI